MSKPRPNTASHGRSPSASEVEQLQPPSSSDTIVPASGVVVTPESGVSTTPESGGGATTQAVVATPSSKGLLRRVIPQSGGHAAQRADTAKAITDAALDRLGVRDLETLRQTPWHALVEIYPELQATPYGRPQIYLPVIGEKMPVHPVDAGHGSRWHCDTIGR